MSSAYRETFILIFLASSLVQLSNLENNWIIHVMHVDCRDHRPAVRVVRCYRNIALLVYARVCLFIVSPASSVLTFTRTSQSVGPKLVEVHQDTVWILNLIKLQWSCAVCKSEACIPCFFTSDWLIHRKAKVIIHFMAVAPWGEGLFVRLDLWQWNTSSSSNKSLSKPLTLHTVYKSVYLKALSTVTSVSV